MPTLREVLNQANPSMLASILQSLQFGDVLRAQPVSLRRAAPNAAPTDMIAAVHSIKLPDHAKAAAILNATAIAGGGAPGQLVIATPFMTAATAATNINISESGDLTFAAADAWTSVDVLYVPAKFEVRTVQLPVVAATGIMALPASITSQGVVTILDATANTAGVPGVKAVTAPGVVPVAAGTVNLDLAKTQVQFVIADAVTLATVKLGLVPSVNVNALLEADAGAYL